MSEHTSKQHTSWFTTRPKTAVRLVFAGLLVITIFLLYQRYQIIKENDRREMTNIAHVVYQNIDQSLENSATSALTLALTINDEGEPENFEDIGKRLTESNQGIDGVQLVPGGIIKYSYPIKENAAANGLDILHTPDVREEALKAIALHKMYFAGPLKLRQGGIGIIGRLPVYMDNKFWGFSAVIIKMETLLKVSGINTIRDTKYYFQLSKIDPQTKREVFFLPNTENFSDKYYETISFPDSGWKLYVITKDKYSIYLQLFPIALLAFLFVIAVGFLLSLLLRKPVELQRQVIKQANRLLKNEAKFKAIFDHAPVGIAYIDSNSSVFKEINEQYCEIVGYTRDELVGKTFIDITHPDDLAGDLAQMEELKEGRILRFSMEKRLIRKSGGPVWINLTVSPLWEHGAEPTTHVAIVEDISLTKEAQEQIRTSEARFKSLFDDSPIALWEEDFSQVKTYLQSLGLLGEKTKTVLAYFNENPEVVKECIRRVKIIDTNNESLRLHNANSKAELLEATQKAMLDEESVKAFIKQLIAITSGAAMIHMETRFKIEGGDFCDIYLRWSVMRGYEESLERVIISTEDITSQKEAQRMISNSQKKIESLVNTIDGIVWESDYGTNEFTFVNQKAEEISGYSAEEWLYDGSFWAKTIYPEDRERTFEFCDKQSKESDQYAFEYRMIAKNGSIIWIRDIVNVIREGGEPVLLRGIMIDITKNKEAENDLTQSFKLVTEQNKRLHNFSYIVSHNLRSHTANIQSITNLIELSDSEEERNELMQMLVKVSGSLNETMMHLNDLLNIQANITSVKEPLRLADYIKNTKNVLSDMIFSKEVTFDNTVPDDVRVNYNPAYLESILLNLISNAIRYSSPSRKAQIVLSWDAGLQMLSISDNGIGIDLARYGDKLFGMYKTFHGNADARGIGLFITKNQIEAMDGTITVESEFGQGTTFHVTFK